MKIRSILAVGVAALSALCTSTCLAGVGCAGDFDGNNNVDGADLAVLLGAWGGPGGDLNGSGSTDGADLAILLGAWGACQSCGVGGDCCVAQFSPFCNDASCCESVCANDPFCCDVQWDSICANAAKATCINCAACGVPVAGDCCTAHSNPFCNDAACCDSVCAVDSFCCNTQWDGICASEAVDLCGGLCAPNVCGGSANDCCSAGTGPGCNDAACCESVCATDPFCCNNTWDGICAGEASDLCAACVACGSDLAGDCCTSHGSPFCNDAACCDTVCAADTFCCTNQWDSICANEAADLCGSLCSPSVCGGSSNDCCAAGSGPGCNDAACCESVCATDPFCCNNTWDGICASEAVDLCGACFGCGTNSTGDCCTSHSSPYCSDAACCETVCAADPFCCNNQWDSICANEAVTMCGICP